MTAKNKTAIFVPISIELFNAFLNSIYYMSYFMYFKRTCAAAFELIYIYIFWN